MKNAGEHNWTFRRLGALDQVVLDQAEDFRRLRELDPKLWVALSCPTAGLEIDRRALELLDTDDDGRLRAPDVLAAVEWTMARLRPDAALPEHGKALPLAAIDDKAGSRLLATARIMLENLGKAGATEIAPAEASSALASLAENMFNGDGIMPPLEQLEPEARAFIADGLAVVGGRRDASGKAGLDRELGEAFLQSLRDWLAWKDGLDQAAHPLGERTAAAWDLILKLKDKIDDYFLRCDLAAYAPQTRAALNVDEKLAPLAENGGGFELAVAGLARLPLSQIEPDRPLRLDAGLNPAWRAEVEDLAALLQPLLDGPELGREKWREIQAAFAPYAESLNSKPAPPSADAPGLILPPAAPPESLGEERAREILAGGPGESFFALVERDQATPATAADFAEVERLTLYYCHLRQLLNNFTSFLDFYKLDKSAAFQLGTLYLDGRGCDLCLPVSELTRHSTLAAFSRMFLVYCECTRRQAPADGGQAEKKLLAAAVTAGGEELLLENRNGVFIDKKGEDWDATVLKVINNPINIRQAMLSPYRRLARTISEQVQKWSGQKEAEAEAGLTGAVSGAAAPAPKFDLGKNLGMFAALGLALGAIGTALASLAGALVSLAWWQAPLVFLAIFLLISGPSMISAAFKLHQRSLAPLLEASGWAMNGRVRITRTLGRALTATAVLPPNSTRTRSDPLKKRSIWPWLIFFLALLAGAAIAAYFLYWKK